MSQTIPIPAELAAEAEPRFDVVMLTTVHRATDGRIFHREAKTLANAGMRVCILGPNPSDEDRGTVSIESIRAAGTRLERLTSGWELFKRSLRLNAKLYIFHDPELLGVGLLLAILGNKVIYDCHENLPMQILQKEWLPKPIRWALVPLLWLSEWAGSRYLAGVVVARDQVLNRFPRGKTIVVRNYPSREAVQILSQGAPVPERRNVVLYSGGISRIRGIGELAEAFRSDELKDAELWLAGEFDDQQFQRDLLAALPANVKWLGWKAPSDVLKLYQHVKIGALLLYPTASHRHSLPVKLFEYLAAGLPVIATNLPEFEEPLCGCGRLVDPMDIRQIRGAVVELLLSNSDLARMSAVARGRSSSLYNWAPEGQRLVQFCSGIIANE